MWNDGTVVAHKKISKKTSDKKGPLIWPSECDAFDVINIILTGNGSLTLTTSQLCSISSGPCLLPLFLLLFFPLSGPPDFSAGSGKSKEIHSNMSSEFLQRRWRWTPVVDSYFNCTLHSFSHLSCCTTSCLLFIPLTYFFLMYIEYFHFSGLAHIFTSLRNFLFTSFYSTF